MIISKREHLQQLEKEKPLSALIDEICSIDHSLLAKKLNENLKWEKPTGDLLHWVNVLNLFDDIFEKHISKYGLDEAYPKLREISPEDSDLLVACLRFTSMLLDHCTNGYIYSSSERIFQLIKTPSIDVRFAALETAIFLGEKHNSVGSKRFNFPKATRLQVLEIAKSYPPPVPAGFLQRRIEQNALSPDENGNKSAHFSLVDTIDITKKHPSKWKQLSFQYYNSKPSEIKPSTKTKKKMKTNNPKAAEGLAHFYLNEEQVRRLSFEQILDEGSECLPKESWFSFSLAASNAKAFNSRSYDSLELRVKLLKMKCAAIAITSLVCNTDYTSANFFETEPYILSFLVDLISPEFSSIVPSDVFYFAVKTLDCIASKRVWGTELVRHLGGNVSHGVMYQLLRHINKKVRNEDEDCFEKSHLIYFTLLSHFIESKSLLPRLASGGLLNELMTFLNVHTKYRWTCSAALNTLSMFLGLSPDLISEFSSNNGFQLLIDTISYEVDFALDNPDFGGGPPKDVVTYYTITLRQVNYLRNLLKVVSNLIQSEAGDRLRNLFDSPILISFNKIISNSHIFGPFVVAATLDDVLYIIHNEPTAFPILKEANVISTILSRYSELFMPAHELLMSLLEILGAISLNKEGLSMVIDSAAIKTYFKSFYELEFAKKLVQADASTGIGCSMDELGRHYPTLRPIIMAEIKDLVDKFPAFANKKLRPLCLYGKGESMFYRNQDDAPNGDDEPQEEINSWEGVHGSNLFDNVISFLSGLLQDSGQWGKECVKEIPFESWESFLTLPNAPYDYVSTNTMINFLSILKYLNDEEKTYGFPEILKLLDKLVDTPIIKSFATHSGEASFFECFQKCPEKGTAILQAINTVNTVLHGITESYLNPTIMVHDRYLSFINYLGSNPTLIPNLVKFMSRCIIEEINIRSTLPHQVIDETSPVTEVGVDSPQLLVYSKEPPRNPVANANNSAKFKNTLQLRFLMNRLQINIVLILTCISRSCMQRRQDYFDADWRRYAVDCTKSLAVSLSDMWDAGNSLNSTNKLNYSLIAMNIISFISKSKDKGKEVLSTPLVSFYFVTTDIVQKIVDTAIVTFDNLTSMLPAQAEDAKISKYVKCSDVSIKANFLDHALLFLEKLCTPGLVSKIPFSSYFYNNGYGNGDSNVIDGILTQVSVQCMRLIIFCVGSKSKMVQQNDFSGFENLSDSTAHSLVTIIRNTWTVDPVDEYYPLKSEWISPVKDEIRYLMDKVGISEEGAKTILQEAKSIRNLHDLVINIDATDSDDWKKCMGVDFDEVKNLFAYQPINTHVVQNFKSDKANESNALFTSTLIKLAMVCKSIVPIISLIMKDRQIAGTTCAALFESIESLSEEKTEQNMGRLSAAIALLEKLIFHGPIPTTFEAAVKSSYLAFVNFFIEELEKRPDLVDSDYFQSGLSLLEPILSEAKPNFLLDVPLLPNLTCSNDLISRLASAVLILSPQKNIRSAITLCRFMYLLGKQEKFRMQVAKSSLMNHLTVNMQGFMESNDLTLYKSLQDVLILSVRVCFETPTTVEGFISAEVTKHMKKGGRHSLRSLVNDTRFLCGRDPEIYIKTVSNMVRLVDDEYGHDFIFLLEKKREDEIKSVNDDVDMTEESDTPALNPPTGLVHLLLTEVMDTYKKDWVSTPETSTTPEPEHDEKKKKESHFEILLKNKRFGYMCFLLQTITELIGSSKEAKLEFITFSKKNSSNESNKPRSTSLNFFIHQLISSQLFVAPTGEEFQRREAISSLAKLAILALVSTTVTNAPDESNPKKEDPDMMVVRKFLMDVVSKILKELFQAAVPTSLTYSKLYDLFDMCGCLLSTKFKELCYPLLDKNATKLDHFYIASAFFDNQLPNQITTALARLDLNFPNIHRIMKVGLKPLSNLAKIKVANAELFESNSLDEEEIEEIEDRDETPDLFRNSTLGMYDIDLDSEEEEEDNYYDEGPIDVMMSGSEMSEDESESGVSSESDMETGEDDDMSEEDLQHQLEGYDSNDSANDIEIIDELAIQSGSSSEMEDDDSDISDFYGFDDNSAGETENSGDYEEEEDEEEMDYDDDELDGWLEAFGDEEELEGSENENETRFANPSNDFSDREFNSLHSDYDEDLSTEDESNGEMDGTEMDFEGDHGSRTREFVTSFFDALRPITHQNVSGLFEELVHRRHLSDRTLRGSIHIGLGPNGNDALIDPLLLFNDKNLAHSKNSFDYMFIRSTIERWRTAFSYFFSNYEKDFLDEVHHRIKEAIYDDSIEIIKKKKEERERLKKEREERERKKKEELKKKREEEARQRELELAANPPPVREPVMLLIGDREVDISGTDIDPEFFEALPEHMREEVFTEHVRERRAQASSMEEDVPEIDPDFLDALPEHIRDEIVHQESLSQRLAGGRFGYLGEGDLDESEEDIDDPSTAHSHVQEGNSDQPQKKKLRNFITPLIDRAGVASLVRLLFAPQPVNQRDHVYSTLLQMCNNKQTRADIMSLLIAILYDGLHNQKSLEKVFNQISAKADHVKSTNTSLPIDATPVSVGVQIIEAVFYLLEKNTALRLFLLTEHDNAFISKKHMQKKKLKNPSTCEERYPINLLFKLLENPLLREENFFIDLLASVLHFGTRPLLVLSDKSKSYPPSFDTNFIPDSNLRLIVRILTSNECVNTTFRRTISAMQHLSWLKNAQKVFSVELSEKATNLGRRIIKDLRGLTEGLKSGTNYDGDEKFINSFTAPSSDQAKLLRILTALDYMFETKSKTGENVDSSREGIDQLTGLYQHLELGNLWDALSECLRVLEENTNLSKVATVLLPLIEALMVVCKHSKVKEIQIKDVMKYEARKIDFKKEPIESLFFSFTDEHKKILNQMVRANPNLMSGPFSMLVRNPKVLEFDNKKNYFDRQLHEGVTSNEKLSISIRRDQVFLDSYRGLFFKSVDTFRNAVLEINFKGEAGVDAGGVTREWYQVLSRQMFNPDYALFTAVASDETTFHPNRTSYINPEHLSFFKFIGRIIGKAIFDNCFLDCHFSRAVYKKILDRPVSLKDMENLDLEYFKSLMWMLENDITDIITEDFSVETDDYGEHKIIDLIPNGRNIPVTEENKQEYVRLVVEYRLQTSVAEQMNNFITGFHEIIPRDLVAIFDEQELELLISGLPDIDVQDWQNNTTYVNYSPSSEQIQWFWRSVKSFDNEERAKLLQFATGTSKVPLNGFKELRGANGGCKFSIHRDYGSTDRLPSSHTCFNQIDLPAYETYETLRGSLLLAITEGHEGFGLA
ncbi:putative E3 ubiquitin-protein ligase [Clavispora lusitaniae]|uniref:E3 ubiquitin-protein ligase n=1 Tax=Clavispora lusitaniae TaxID=36911 RepID=A0ACD0WGM8_CLALS|nr:E3 ubiquitin-protein ligase tom1 [Clavispora lusitaniae]QFZ26454.1 putative E3 ubiquitin-protein ligase [Clavispora lusitaniae]QFZ32122.1 putative E3 ubiquitin-protein ligase [Clavispora lusitaniae]QFZ37791.1 putative E3 ubiquitin-protein ligase [Clavispora lusitaniae]QFZ43475.1 putative E3 ubiquitin-protein ligase [Clavispora lusitaniae]